MAAGIDWASQNNRADVLSLSWRIRVGQQAITDALNRAVTQGRNGLGCLVLAASANDNTNLDFPASVPSVIAVGATTQTDQRAIFSNFGTGLDVVAPGTSIYTTDLQGAAGYSGTDYTLSFTGTSAACPNAAGVAALILAANPSLTQAQARKILESTTDKSGGYTYATGAGEDPSLTWNNQVGYGRVNACSAVRQALLSSSIVGPGLICSGSSTYSLATFATVPLQWTSSNTAVATINSSTGVATRVGTASGAVIFTATASSGCGSISLSRTIAVGAPTPSITARLASAPGEPTDFEFTAPAFTGANITYSWYVNNVLTETTPDNVWHYYFQCRKTNTITCSINSCNTTSARSNAITETGECIRTYSFAPNPATTELVIQEEATTSSTTTAASFEAQLYNGFGQVVANGRSQQGILRLNVQHLPDGLYTLRAGVGSTALNKHIQITH